MSEHDEALDSANEHLADLRAEGLHATAQLLGDLTDAIQSGTALGASGVLAAVARSLEELERRVVALERGN